MSSSVFFGNVSGFLVVLLEYFAHDAIGTGRLRHAGTRGDLGLVAQRTAGGTLESNSARTLQVSGANCVYYIYGILSCGFSSELTGY